MAETDIKLPYKLPNFHDWQPQATFYHPLYAGSIDGTDLYPHDRAVVRAMLSTYKPNKNVDGDPKKTLFVSRLSKETSQDTIEKIFEKFGELEKCRLIRDFVTGFSRGYAFVEFKRKKDAWNAARETHKTNVDGKQILVDFECERNLEGWKPRRFGGGFGGRKESGQLRFGGIDRPFRRPLPENVNHFAQANKTSQGLKEDQETMNKDHQRYSTQRRNHEYKDKDYGGSHDDRNRKKYKSSRHESDRNHGSSSRRDRHEHHSKSRGLSKDYDDYRSCRDHKDRDYKERRDYKDTQKDYKKPDQKDDWYHRTEKRRCRDKKDKDSRDTRDEARSESSNSSRN